MSKTAEILARLHEIEQDIRVVYACESGSRAWGFPSTDSDYDVRFIYVRPVKWYLSIGESRDVIERPAADLDISGWDLRKALRLFNKSNPPLLEWLDSPIVYMEKLGVAARMRSLIPEYYSPVACLFHYYHMAEGNYRSYFNKKDRVWLKKYLYVLRPLLAIRWIERGYGPVPTLFQKLVDSTVEETDVRQAINELVKQKMAGTELDWGSPIPILQDFLRSEFARADQSRFHEMGRKRPNTSLDNVFVECLENIWGELP